MGHAPSRTPCIFFLNLIILKWYHDTRFSVGYVLYFTMFYGLGYSTISVTHISTCLVRSYTHAHICQFLNTHLLQQKTYVAPDYTKGHLIIQKMFKGEGYEGIPLPLDPSPVTQSMDQILFLKIC